MKSIFKKIIIKVVYKMNMYEIKKIHRMSVRLKNIYKNCLSSLKSIEEE